ncbi:SSI family serine proteinase inhibitor [Actinotalea fermentans]|uniref:Subtilisin inhibitor domain-containing protein n=1 Tax=Actinotalea fermentans TaxID=43671 RepID=A0A511Z0U5_9CELL|nr:SSI family serine proteinase inhibitor [Actinotalea fermentans]KGM15695.1 hypothetical protein N867_06380 [Actinotalea fermentans ATCC 43279 = JCM 9966 = DSM 3133]GEN81042.1 hypothetical protein AFE02nite_27760 [Actinotalea fermentans]
MRRTRAQVAAVVAVVLVAALGGCQTGRDDDGLTPGTDDDPVSSDEPPAPGDDTPAPGEPAEPVAADLTVVVDATGEGATTTYTLTCEPAGGHHPDAEAACAAIAAGGGTAAFAPTPMDVACTEQWGGPQTASVTGTVGGEPVSAAFSRANGCEISRWDTLAPLFGPDAGLL